MERNQQNRLEKNYLTASAVAIFTAFLCINLYPEYHGAPQIGQSGLIALSAAMIAMMVYIVRKAFTDRAPDSENESPPSSDPARLRRMFFLWSACTVLLAVSLLRYPLYLQIRENAAIGWRGQFSLISGGAIIVFTIGFVLYRWKDYRKL